MATPVGCIGSSPYTLPDLRWRPGRSNNTGRQDPVVTKAARSDSDPTMKAAGDVTIDAQIWAASRFDNVGSNVEKCERMVHECDAASRDVKTKSKGDDRHAYREY